MLKTFTFTLACLSFPAALMAQTIPPLTSSINGTIWQEAKPYNGIRADSEQKIAGILVNLLDAGSFEVVSSALSNASGEFSLKANAGTYVIEYIYPSDGFAPTTQRAGSDNTVNSAADDSNYSPEFTIADNETISEFGLGLTPKDNTITYCTQKESIVTEWSQSLLLPKSTVKPVPLNVKLFAAESVYHPMIGIENTGTANAYSITTAGKITMTMPINPPSFVMNSDVTINGALADYDGQEDYDGASGATFYNRASFAYGYPARNTSSLSVINNNFVGSAGETFSIPTTAQSSVAFTGSGNLKTSVQTYVSAGACVVYTYAEGALPVTLASFGATTEGKVANLNWTTTEETGSREFEIQRSTDGKSWSVIGAVQAKGTTKQTNHYDFTDPSPRSGQNLYRLKMIDLDGTFAFSSIKAVSFGIALTIYPNPATDELHVSTAFSPASLKVSIYKHSGQLVKEVEGKTVIDIRTLPAGIYQVSARDGNGEQGTTNLLVTR
jgi:hypothetical protein